MAEASTAPTYVATYHYVPEMAERRGPFRAEHLARIHAAQREGWLILAGAFADPVDSAMLVVRGRTPAEILAWAAEDPYATGGLIRGITIREMTTVPPPAA